VENCVSETRKEGKYISKVGRRTHHYGRYKELMKIMKTRPTEKSGKKRGSLDGGAGDGIVSEKEIQREAKTAGRKGGGCWGIA